MAFRGTNGPDIKNWGTNFEIKLVPYPNVTNAMVHSGWWSAYMNVREDLLHSIENMILDHPTANLYFTGHSLGATLSLYAALDVK